MSNQFIGEVRMFGGNFAPAGWAMCNGQTLSISQNTALYSLIGTTYGGDGVQTFLLPNLQGRIPVGQGQGLGLTNRIIGTPGGEEGVTITAQTMAQHNHAFNATTQVTSAVNVGNTVLPGAVTGSVTGDFYVINGTPAPTLGTLSPTSVGFTGGSLPHDNIMPSLCVTFIVALVGTFPSRN